MHANFVRYIPNTKYQSYGSTIAPKDQTMKFTESLARDWEDLDTDDDHRLSRSEFSAFEQTENKNPAEAEIQKQKDKDY